MEEHLRNQLLLLGTRFEAATGLSMATIGKRALNDNTVFGRLSNPALSFNVRTFDRLVEWLSKNWPVNAAWPSEIRRPITEDAHFHAAKV